MADLSQPPKSPTLIPPRKSVELEDPGAHDIEVSEAEDDVFSDAQEARNSNSGRNSPLSTTKIDKADDRERHEQATGPATYNQREQGAVAVGRRSSPPSGTGQQKKSPSLTNVPIPKMVVEKIDPASPSHGDVPGTAAHAKRQADAVPDAILRASEHGEAPVVEDRGGNISAEIPIPTTVITKVDSNPSHGEIPGTDAFDMRKGDAKPDVVEKKGDVSDRSKLSKPKRTKSPVRDASMIAADGGFGPMHYEESEDESVESKHDEHGNDADANFDEGFGDDFDDFESGSENEDFGDFDDGFEQSPIVDEAPSETDPPPNIGQSLPPLTSPFSLLDFSELDTLDDIIAATSPYLDELFPSTRETHPPAPPAKSDLNSIFLTDRSLSLWSQLVAPPPLQPPNWVRSRIRRLFLVSLGVPVDLDEILPASKQKKLILPSIHPRNRSQSPPDGRRTGSRVRLQQDNASSASVDQPFSNKTSRRRKGPPLAPELDLRSTKMLCATTYAALCNMTDDELQAHVKKLEELTAKASEVLEYWLKRRDSAVGDKEAFEGVIENLVKHARRVRKK